MFSDTLSTTATSVTFKQPVSTSLPAKVKKTESSKNKEVSFHKDLNFRKWSFIYFQWFPTIFFWRKKGTNFRLWPSEQNFFWKKKKTH